MKAVLEPAAAGTAGAAGPFDASRRAAIIAVPAILTVHNLEELLAMPRVLPTLADRLPEAVRGVFPSITMAQFAAALAVATVVPWALALLALAGRRGALRLLLVVQATMLVNVASHLGSAAMLGGYAPGLATALALNLPFSIYLLRRARREQWIGPRAWTLLFPLALLVHGPLLVGLLWILGRSAGTS
jgi:Protein of unknown function with HXXEE motif